MLNVIWFQNHSAKWLLAPFSLVFWLLSGLRRWLFRLGIKSQSHPGVPVVVVGNISVGGNGKTPVVLAVTQWLIDAGYQPGILSRGYGGSCRTFPHQVSASDCASEVGDEPRLMASRLAVPVVIDPKRARGATKLVGLGCDVIVCDDGLQHYALQRDIEWVVMDDRGVGNGFLLPMGPLRELPKRLNQVDAVIHNGATPRYSTAHLMSLVPTVIKPVGQKDEDGNELTIDEFLQRYPDGVDALAGIGDPKRFFNTLDDMNVKVNTALPFADHHAFTASDIPSGPTIMTEKDAVKCAEFAHQDCWYLQVEAQLPDSLRYQFLDKLGLIASNYAKAD